MNLTEMIAALRFRLGNKKGIDGEILREIQFAQSRLEEDPTIPYWFLVQFSSIILPEGGQDVAFPAGFIREYDGVLPAIVIDGKYTELTRYHLDQARGEFGTAVGQPLVYVIIDSVFKVYPTPDKEYILDFPHVRSEGKLSNIDPVLEDNAWTANATQMLMNKAGIAIAQALRDKDALGNFTNDFNVAFAEMMSRVVAREESNLCHQRGGHTNALGN